MGSKADLNHRQSRWDRGCAFEKGVYTLSNDQKTTKNLKAVAVVAVADANADKDQE